jgi:hypothetical protein
LKDKNESEVAEIVDEILIKYKSLEFLNSQSEIEGMKSENRDDPLDKILEMTQKHKQKVVDVQKMQNKEDKKSENYVYYSQLTGGDDESSDNKEPLNLEVNTNAQSVLEKEKKQREQLHEVLG